MRLQFDEPHGRERPPRSSNFVKRTVRPQPALSLSRMSGVRCPVSAFPARKRIGRNPPKAVIRQARWYKRTIFYKSSVEAYPLLCPLSRVEVAVFLPAWLGWLVKLMWSCRAGDGTAGRRLTCSDARIVYRLTEFRLGLVPILRRASVYDRPHSGSTGVPHRGPVSSFARRMLLVAQVIIVVASPVGVGST
jgi:hypothetical protein